MKKNNTIKKFLFFLCLILSLNMILANENISLELLSDKQIYQVGENVSLTLKISNPNKNSIQGQIKGKIIIGDVGYEIQCFDYKIPNNKTQHLSLNPLPASLSNSNRKTMSTLYSCSGSQIHSTKTLIDNKPINQSGEEIFELGPFIYSYSQDKKKYNVKSNTLKITVIKSQNNKNENKDKNNGQSLSKQKQQALANNQQNSQSINQLKQDITSAKKNPLNTDIQTEEKKSFWTWFFILLVLMIISIFIYFKYLKKEEEIPTIEKKPELPEYIKLLNKIKLIQDEKEKAKLLSQAIKIYISKKNNLDVDLSHSKAIKLTQNKLFKDILKKTEKIEFAKMKIKLNYNELVKNVRGEFK
jgi:hypothetical protein